MHIPEYGIKYLASSKGEKPSPDDLFLQGNGRTTVVYGRLLPLTNESTSVVTPASAPARIEASVDTLA